jgi:hypothetical protein
MIQFETVREKAVELIASGMGEPMSPDLHSLLTAFLNDAFYFGKLEAQREMLVQSRYEAPLQ